MHINRACSSTILIIYVIPGLRTQHVLKRRLICWTYVHNLSYAYITDGRPALSPELRTHEDIIIVVTLRAYNDCICILTARCVHILPCRIRHYAECILSWPHLLLR